MRSVFMNGSYSKMKVFIFVCIVLVSRVSGHYLDTQTLTNHPSGEPK